MAGLPGSRASRRLPFILEVCRRGDLCRRRGNVPLPPALHGACHPAPRGASRSRDCAARRTGNREKYICRRTRRAGGAPFLHAESPGPGCRSIQYAAHEPIDRPRERGTLGRRPERSRKIEGDRPRPLHIEPKNVDAISIANYVRLFASSNEDWPVPIDIDDRRSSYSMSRIATSRTSPTSRRFTRRWRTADERR